MMKNLKVELYKEDIALKHVAELLGITEKTFRRKLKGVSDFTWREISIIKLELFPNIPYEVLFERTQSTA